MPENYLQADPLAYLVAGLEKEKAVFLFQFGVAQREAEERRRDLEYFLVAIHCPLVVEQEKAEDLMR
jgi:hypothetical protein